MEDHILAGICSHMVCGSPLLYTMSNPPRVILPLLAEYADAGNREPKDRFIYSLRSNLRYQLIVLSSGAAGMIYFFFQTGVRVTSLKALVMALAYAWGLILAIYLMGHGLVAIPRHFYRSASISGTLRRIQTQAPRVHERMVETNEELAHLEAQVLQLRQRKNGTARDFQEWIEELADASDTPDSRIGQGAIPGRTDATIPAVITERYLADLTRKLKIARHKRIGYIEEWDRLVQDSHDTQAILDASGSKKLDFGRPSSQGFTFGKFKPLTPTTRYYLHANVLPFVRLVLSGVFAIASVSIIWSEVFKSAVPKICIVGLSLIHHPSSPDGQIGFAGQVMAACWLLYMCAAALTSMREVKVWRGRALVRRHTYGESACWYACQVAKLSVPLSYNFITFVPKEIYEETIFYQFLGKLINLTPLGTGFSSFFPILILIPVCATAFGLYGKVKSIAGFGMLDEEDNEEEGGNAAGFGTGGWREGRTLIERHIHNEGAGRASANNNTSSLGLRTRDHSPASLPPPVTNYSAPTPSSRVLGNARATPRRVAAAAGEDERAENEGFFSDFAHRVRNTIDTIERPEWVQEVAAGLGQRPKWMNGNEGDSGGGGQSKVGQGLTKWFGGGRQSDGRVRL